jgi:hypothetical protein
MQMWRKQTWTKETEHKEGTHCFKLEGDFSKNNPMKEDTSSPFRRFATASCTQVSTSLMKMTMVVTSKIRREDLPHFSWKSLN